MPSAMSTGASSALRLREKRMNASARKARLRRGIGADESPPASLGVDVATNIEEQSEPQVDVARVAPQSCMWYEENKEVRPCNDLAQM